MTGGWISGGLECREETTAVDRDLEVTHTNTHTHIYMGIYIYSHSIYIYVYTYVYIRRIYVYIHEIYIYTRSEAVRVTETSQRESSVFPGQKCFLLLARTPRRVYRCTLRVDRAFQEEPPI